MKIAIIGQSIFATSVYRLLQEEGHEIVGVFTISDSKGREDHLATSAISDNVPLFKISRWRIKGQIIPEVFEQYKSVGAELNVLPYCSQFIPMEVINFPVNKSIIYHPSLLPAHRGAAAINWTLIHGDKKGGFTIFWADDGLDTGPILLQEEINIEENDTVESLYNRFLFPEGIEGMAEAVSLISQGIAPTIKQSDVGATYEPILNTKEITQIKFNELNQQQLHNFIRGCDKIPGAWINIQGQQVKCFGSSIWKKDIPTINVRSVLVEGMSESGLVHSEGLILFGSDGKAVNVSKLELGSGKMIAASKFNQTSEDEKCSEIGELTSLEIDLVDELRKIWSSILHKCVEECTDFFDSGASSMDVTRMVEEVRQKFQIEIENADVYMAPTFESFSEQLILESRGSKGKITLEFKSIKIEANGHQINLPTQLFINNEFVDSSDPMKMLKVINPTDESLICQVQCATVEDVDKAVVAAQTAFEQGEWSQMNARDRGKLLLKLADLMEEHKEELATIESIDSGAVYTLAIKTHVGMSIDTWRYFAGCCDKIEGKTIPINNARPNKNLTFTRREPIGVCALITPWNYPLMMVSWKMAACLAAGNTCVLKPAQVCPLTALKLAELSVYAGFPPGVINIVPGTGSICGQALADHPQVRKLGFTGSTPIGQQIMKSCANSNLKKVSLELGGKSPLIIFTDCDLNRAVKQAMSGVFFNKGENCIAAGRIFVQDGIYTKFIRKVVSETRKISIGDPLDRSISHGPQNHRAHFEKLIDYCKIGVEEGATLLYGGRPLNPPEVKGLFFMPTIFTDVTDQMFIAKEESFGPIMIISRFPNGDLDGVLARANATEFGLCAGVFTKDLAKAMKVAEKIHAGTCFINCYNKTDVAAPFGGFKQSGFGKDLGQDALNEFLLTKTVTMEY